MQIKDIEIINLNLFIISFLFSKRGARLLGHHNNDHGPIYLPAVLSTVTIIMMINHSSTTMTGIMSTIMINLPQDKNG